jgi:hypothetical protein
MPGWKGISRQSPTRPETELASARSPEKQSLKAVTGVTASTG